MITCIYYLPFMSRSKGGVGGGGGKQKKKKQKLRKAKKGKFVSNEPLFKERKIYSYAIVSTQYMH